jgi:hypothetical protein
VIKPSLERKAAAEEISKEATRERRAATLGPNLGNGLTEFKLGNLPAEDVCEVEICCGFVASLSGPNELFFTFPLDPCTASGSAHCITDDLSGGFNFSLRNARRETVSAISSNVAGVFNGDTCTYAVNVPALFLQTKLKAALSSLSYCSGSVLLLTGLLPAAAETTEAKEFVFVVDCSGSNKRAFASICLFAHVRAIRSSTSFGSVVRLSPCSRPTIRTRIR